jgi:hypothetical protein
MASLEVDLAADDLRQIDAAAASIEIQGARGTGIEQYG